MWACHDGKQVANLTVIRHYFAFDFDFTVKIKQGKWIVRDIGGIDVCPTDQSHKCL